MDVIHYGVSLDFRLNRGGVLLVNVLCSGF
uniref:Uncharacterized protein n=1 Tax=Rhizophora mucronata TaxID=61149 RepID=A0A2P2NMK7_RHIMU